MPGDYNGDGKMDIAIWRPKEGQWYIKDQQNVVFGQPQDIPMTWNVWILWTKKLLPASINDTESASAPGTDQALSPKN